MSDKLFNVVKPIYLEEINSRFNTAKTKLQLLDHDVSDIESLRKVGKLIFDNDIIKNNK